MATRGRKQAAANAPPETPAAATAPYGKVVLAVVVLAVGIAGALLFRRSGPALSTVDPDDSPLTLREEGPEPLYVAEGQSPAAPSGHTGGSAAPAQLASISPFDRDDPQPPAIDTAYPGEAAEADTPLRPLASGGEAEPPEPDEDRPVARLHRIADGDDLASLAERYLGDAARAGEIYEANRHVLVDPEVLPIGVELAIPPR